MSIHGFKNIKNHGPDGLVDGRGRGKPDTTQTEEEKIRAENAALRARNEYLETENAALKKLEEMERELMSRVGKCIDNGPMENFWGIIKEEMYRLKTYQSFEELDRDIKQYIRFYNTQRVTLKMALNISA